MLKLRFHSSELYSFLPEPLTTRVLAPFLACLGLIGTCVLPPTDLYCTLEVDSFGYFVSKAKTRVFRDTTEPKWDEVSGGGLCPSLSSNIALC